MSRQRYVASIARRRGSMPGPRALLDYRPFYGAVVAPDGALSVIPITASEEEAEALQRDLTALAAGFPAPEDALDHLYVRNGTVVAHGRPTTISAKSPREAVQKLVEREEKSA